MKRWIHASSSTDDYASHWANRAIVHVDEVAKSHASDGSVVLDYHYNSPEKFVNAVVGYIEDEGPKFKKSEWARIKKIAKMYFNESYGNMI